MKFLKVTGIIFSLIASLAVKADIKLPTQFSDHMVLQRDKPVPVWGWAAPAEKISVTFNKQKKTVVIGADGKWRVHLDKLSAGGPFMLLVKGKNSITLSDVYVGEVWLCSGQSKFRSD